jgi:hypothetical protein
VDVSAHGAVGILLHQEVEEAPLVLKAALRLAIPVVRVYKAQYCNLTFVTDGSIRS